MTRPWLRDWSIARKIALLIFVAMLLLTGANFAVTFAGPPPRPAPAQIADLVSILRDPATPLRPDMHLVVEGHAASFTPRSGEARRPEGAAHLARLLSVAPDHVALATAVPLRIAGDVGLGPNSLVGAYSIGLREETGRWRILRSAPQPLLTAWHRTTIGITIGLTILLGLIATRITKDIVRPIQRLSQEADQAYLEGARGEITVDGPPEVAHLARTVAAMRDRFAGMVESRTMMLAAIAHDMATPLARLEFHVHKLPEKIRSQAEADLSELSGLIASILSYAKGQQRLDQHPVDLAALTGDVVARYHRADAPVILADAPGAVWVSGDRLALTRLIGNLVGNAQRYAGGGEVMLAQEDMTVTLTVADEGPGFAPALAERLFDPFYRIESSRNRETAGTGLGLATARVIAEAHGGTLMAQGAPGKGARFTLMLPMLEQTA